MKRSLFPVVLVLGLVAAAVLVQTGRVPSPFASLAPPGLTESAGEPDDEALTASKFLTARFVAREAVARELLSGRLTVAEAAAVFAWLDDQPPVVPPSLMNQGWATHRGFLADLIPGSREDWLCLRAAECARQLACFEWPDRAGELGDALEAQVRQAWAGGEARRLPAVNERDCRCLLDRSITGVEAFSALGPVPAVPVRDLRLIAGVEYPRPRGIENVNAQ